MSSVKFPCNISNISLLNSMIIKIYYIKKIKLSIILIFKKGYGIMKTYAGCSLIT